MHLNTSEAYKAYQQNQVEGQPQEKLVLMLYEGAVRFLNLSLQALEKKDMEKAHHNILKAESIILELWSTLNMEAGELALNFSALYEYMNRRLIEGNVQKDKGPLLEVRGMLQELKDAWKEALKKL